MDVLICFFRFTEYVRFSPTERRFEFDDISAFIGKIWTSMDWFVGEKSTGNHGFHHGSEY